MTDASGPGAPSPAPVDTPADSGRVALVTGGSRGIGFGIARALVARGDRVCITGRTEESLREAVKDLGADRAMYVVGKAHDGDHRAEAVERVISEYGRLDHLVNNAGTNPVFGGLADLDLAVVRKIYETNVISALGFAQLARTAWQGEHGGTIVNVASVAGLNSSPFVGAYGMSKAAMINLTQQLAHEFAPSVRVNAVAPAVVRTRFAAALYEGREEQVLSRYPLGRLGTPEDIGGAVAFLTSSDSAWMTGQTLLLDGGLFLNAGVS
ncbi:SDR family oxidoreductase [Streptomyces calidiresistens]|uniref:Glucose 1-dehydrogenase n=1 Tax=Streptomyces calidiresistens TaxID=1485586 RepID=A0A7W3T2I9_9ACTN|nr:SDR family oxidoreductase [Streptomyces calidiresistens]MBB0229618.1 glucose 1-dehydrogenase [Streptomyces calidiresistens]